MITLQADFLFFQINNKRKLFSFQIFWLIKKHYSGKNYSMTDFLTEIHFQLHHPMAPLRYFGFDNCTDADIQFLEIINIYCIHSKLSNYNEFTLLLIEN